MKTPDTTRSGDGDFLRWVVVGVLILTCSMAAGFSWRTYASTQRSASSSPAPPDTVVHAATTQSDTAARVVTSAASAPTPDVGALVAALRQAKTRAVEKAAYAPRVEEDDATIVTTTTTDTMSTLFVGPPPDVLSELLYGQELVAKTFWGNYGWTVERGEVIEITVNRMWEDPEQISYGAYVTFVVMADGKGMRASGLLRYYGDGSEGNRYMVRDFTPTRVERVGSW